jgi:sugar/nucleoside kinase (ribokinase family)
MKQLDLVIIGHLAYEEIITPFGKKTVLGGAGHYSLIPASLFSKRVGIVSCVGKDYDLSFLQKLKVDISGIRVIPDGLTARFGLSYKTDLIKRKVKLEFNVLDRMTPREVPVHFLDSKYIHIATNTPHNQIKFINFLRRKTKAKLSIDTIEQYIEKWPKEVFRAFSLVDLIFVNQRENELLKSLKNKEKIIKKGIQGADYYKDGEKISVPAPHIRHVVDTTGSGDVLAGVFLVLLAKGLKTQDALKKAVQVASWSITDFGVEHLLLR